MGVQNPGKHNVCSYLNMVGPRERIFIVGNAFKTLYFLLSGVPWFLFFLYFILYKSMHNTILIFIYQFGMPFSCVIQFVDGLFESRLNVLEGWYDEELLKFSSSILLYCCTIQHHRLRRFNYVNSLPETESVIQIRYFSYEVTSNYVSFH